MQSFMEFLLWGIFLNEVKWILTIPVSAGRIPEHALKWPVARIPYNMQLLYI